MMTVAHEILGQPPHIPVPVMAHAALALATAATSDLLVRASFHVTAVWKVDARKESTFVVVIFLAIVSRFVASPIVAAFLTGEQQGCYRASNVDGEVFSDGWNRA